MPEYDKPCYDPGCNFKPKEVKPMETLFQNNFREDDTFEQTLSIPIFKFWFIGQWTIGMKVTVKANKTDGIILLLYVDKNKKHVKVQYQPLTGFFKISFEEN